MQQLQFNDWAFFPFLTWNAELTELITMAVASFGTVQSAVYAHMLSVYSTVLATQRSFKMRDVEYTAQTNLPKHACTRFGH